MLEIFDKVKLSRNSGLSLEDLVLGRDYLQAALKASRLVMIVVNPAECLISRLEYLS